jgi:hypothetical protein
MTDRRTPPHDHVAEAALIGIAILDNTKIAEIIPIVDPGDFYSDRNRAMWEAVVALSCANKEVSLASLYRKLNDTVQASEISKVVDGVQQGADAVHYAKIVRNKAKLRKIIEASVKLSGAAYEGDVDSIVGLISDLANKKITGKREHTLSEDILKWVENSTGPFTATDCYNSLQGATPRDRPNVRMVLYRLKDKGVIEPTGKRDGQYRLVDNKCPEMDWRSAPDDEMGITLPLGLNELVSIYGKSLIVIAGQSNQGKSAILLNFIKDNMDRMPIHYFTSEFGPSMVKKRFSLFDDVSMDDWKVKVYARAHDFHDILRPDEINVIDWLWSGTAFYEAGGDLEKIFTKLNNGIALVALQKDPGKEYGRGGAITMDLASLYLSVFPGEVKIIKAKNWKVEENPNGKVLKIKIVHGAKLIPDGAGWQYPESYDTAEKAVFRPRKF